MRTLCTPLVALVGSALALGCASGSASRYARPEADLGAIRTVAVLPFASLTGDGSHAAKVQRLFAGELLALGAVEVVEPGRVAQLVEAERISSAEALAPADLARIGKALGADGLFVGTVVDYAERYAGGVAAPEIAIQMRLIEVATGATAWEATATRSGPNAKARLFGFGGDSLAEAARQLIRSELERLVR